MKASGIYQAREEDELTQRKWDSTLTFTEELGAILDAGTRGGGGGKARDLEGISKKANQVVRELK